MHIMNASTLIVLIILIAVIALAVYFSVRSSIEDFRTEEGCKGCAGLCTTNGGYCPRKDKYHSRPPKQLYYRLKKEEAAKKMYTTAAVCINENREVCSFSDKKYMMIYRVNGEGITSRKLLSFDSLSHEKQMKLMKDNHVKKIAASGFSDAEVKTLNYNDGLETSIVKSGSPDTAVGEMLGNSYERVTPNLTFSETIKYRLKHLYRKYPDAGTTILGAVGTTCLLATFAAVAVFIILLLLPGHVISRNLGAGVIFFSVFLQLVSYLIIAKCDERYS